MNLNNLVDPAILFFVVGVLAGLLRSNLEIPPAISRFLSMYLLMALGLKGGFALAASGLNTQVVAGLGIAVVLATHERRFAGQCDRLLRVRQGRIELT